MAEPDGKAYRKPIFNKQCRVCGDKATCFNFNGLSCETCKIFFRRNAARSDQLVCRREGNCPIDFYTRKCCPSCRLRKCFSIGMQLKSPRTKRNHQPIISNTTNENIRQIICNKVPVIQANPSFSLASLLESDIKQKIVQCESSDQENSNQSSLSEPLPLLKKDKPFELNELEQRLIDEIRTATSSSFIEEKSLQLAEQPQDLKSVLNLPTSYVSKIVKFCKHIPTFRSLSQEDQLTIVKPFFFEILTVRFSYYYNSVLDGIPVIADESGERAVIMPMETLRMSKHENAFENCRKIMKNLQDEIEGDENIRDLLIVQLLFQTRDELSCKEFIGYQFSIYRHLLLKYLQFKYQSEPKANKKYWRFIELLEEHLKLKEIIRDMLKDIGVSQVSHVLAEIYNL